MGYKQQLVKGYTGLIFMGSLIKIRTLSTCPNKFQYKKAEPGLKWKMKNGGYEQMRFKIFIEYGIKIGFWLMASGAKNQWLL